MTTDEQIKIAEAWRQQQLMNGGCGSTVIYAVIVAIIVLFASCATKSRVAETNKEIIEVVVDSSQTKNVKIDSDNTTQKTSIKESENTQTDTKVEKSDSTVMVVDTQGNVIKQETWHKEKETVSRNREYEKLLKDSIAKLKLTKDSLYQYIAKCDSLQERISHKEKVITEKIKIPKIYTYALVFSIIVIIFAIYKILKWLQIIH